MAKKKENLQEAESYTGESIQVLKGLEAVRMRPAMYIGDTAVRGLHHLFYEVIDNSIDEALAGYCDTITVTLREDNVVEVQDNGRGIPVDLQPDTGLPALEVVMTMLHAGGKFGGGGYKVSGGLHGVGVSAVNALSEWCEVEVHLDGNIWRQRYERGVPTTKVEKIGKTKLRGTTTRYLADREIFGDYTYEPERFVHRIRELAYLNKGVRILWNSQAEGRSEEFHFKTGIAAYVEWLNRNKDSLHKAIYFQKIKDDAEVEIALQYNDSWQENLYSYANNIHTVEGGTHLSGFKTALTRVFNQYARKANILKEKDSNLTGDDVREGLTAVVSVKILHPQFEGQTKTKLGNSEVEGIVNSIVGEGLATYFEENPAVAKRVIDKALQASRARDAARKAADLVKRQSALESGSLPGKLADCSERDPSKSELFIVEGQSAGGNAKTGRDRKFQAILPLRGKVINVEKARIDKALGNEEIRALITALGAGIASEVGTRNGGSADGTEEEQLDLIEVEQETTSQFDLKKLRYHKIVIMTDADVDGSHIRTLLLTFFFRFMRPLITNGYVYIAQPPLYRIKVGKETLYAKDDAHLALLREQVKRKADVTRFKGLGEMDAEDLWETTMNPANRTLLRVTMEDAVLADEIFTMLMGDKVEPRREFIERHATEVRHLDV